MQFHSAYGEDRMLFEYFGRKRSGLCVEVGGFDGVTGSNSFFFEELGWDTVVVEPNPDYAEKIRERRPKAKLFECAAGARSGEIILTVAHGAEAYSTIVQDKSHMDRIHRLQARLEEIAVPMRTMDDILREVGWTEIDFITIDVEGAEETVLLGLDLSRWAPRIVILENNFGRFSLRLYDLMLRHDYHFYRRTGCNDWYVSGREAHVATSLRRLCNWIRASVFRVVGTVLEPFKMVWRESGLKAWNHRRIRARRARKAARQR